MKKEERLFQAIDRVNDQYLADALDCKRSRKPRNLKILAAAAAACICVFAIVFANIGIITGPEPVTVIAYGNKEEIGWQKPSITQGTIDNDGTLHGMPLEFYVSGNSIKSIRFSCKKGTLSYCNRREDVYENFAYGKNFTLNYEDETDYSNLLIDWVPEAVVRKLMNHENIRIRDLSDEEREDVIVMQVTYKNGDTQTQAVTVNLTDDGHFEAKVVKYRITSEDTFVQRQDSRILHKGPWEEENGNTQKESQKKEGNSTQRKSQEKQGGNSAQRKSQEKQGGNNAQRKSQEEQSGNSAQRKSQEEQGGNSAQRKSQEESDSKNGGDTKMNKEQDAFQDHQSYHIDGYTITLVKQVCSEKTGLGELTFAISAKSGKSEAQINRWKQLVNDGFGKSRTGEYNRFSISMNAGMSQTAEYRGDRLYLHIRFSRSPEEEPELALLDRDQPDKDSEYYVKSYPFTLKDTLQTEEYRISKDTRLTICRLGLMISGKEKLNLAMDSSETGKKNCVIRAEMMDGSTKELVNTKKDRGNRGAHYSSLEDTESQKDTEQYRFFFSDDLNPDMIKTLTFNGATVLLSHV